MKIVNSIEMGNIDRKAIEEYGIPSMILMENAGMRVWKAVLEDMPELKDDIGTPLVFLSGKGNNGGDACVMARQAFTDGFRDISVVSWGSGVKNDPNGQKGFCVSLGIRIVQWEIERKTAEELIDRAKIIFDGLTGTGIKGRAREDLEEVITLVNRAPGKRIAVDIPSGLGDHFRSGFPVVNAGATYTIGMTLNCLYLPAGREFCGRIRLVKICFPLEETEKTSIPGELSSWKDIAGRIPLPGKTAYKNSRGHLHVYAGSEGTTGAAWLAANTAALSLAGLVTLHTDSRVYNAAAGTFRSVMVRPWDPDEANSRGENKGPGEVKSREYYLVGPGWGLDRPESRRKWLSAVMNRENTRGVLDADGLTILAGGGKEDENSGGEVKNTDMIGNLEGRWILTPHPGEFARMIGKSVREILDDPLPQVLKYSKKTGAVVVLKSHVLFIGLPDGRYHIVDGMNPAMGTGGSGDVLAGIIAGLLTAGADTEDAAAAGVCLHQEAGRLEAERNGWFRAEDLLGAVREVLGTVI